MLWEDQRLQERKKLEEFSALTKEGKIAYFFREKYVNIEDATLSIFLGSEFSRKLEDDLIVALLSAAAQQGVTTLRFVLTACELGLSRMYGEGVAKIVSKLGDVGSYIRHVSIEVPSRDQEDYFSCFAIEAAEMLKSTGANLESLHVAANDKGAKAFSATAQALRERGNLKEFRAEPIDEWDQQDTNGVVEAAMALNVQESMMGEVARLFISFSPSASADVVSVEQEKDNAPCRMQ